MNASIAQQEMGDITREDAQVQEVMLEALPAVHSLQLVQLEDCGLSALRGQFVR